MSDINYVRECFHNPSNQCTEYGMFIDFLFGRSKIISGDSDVSICACCRRHIVPPNRYCNRQWLVNYVIASVLIGLMYGAGVLLLTVNWPHNYVFFAVGAYALFLTTMALIDRIASSAVFTLQKWEIADFDMPADLSHIAPDANNLVFVTQKQHCHRLKAHKSLALLIGGLPFALLLGISEIFF